MDRFVQDLKSQGVPSVEGDGGNVVFSSAGELFVFYKKCMVQCSQLSTGPPLLSLTGTFQKYLKEYATRVLNNHLPVKWVEQKPLDWTQSLSFPLVIERLERARCATARETGVSKVDGRAGNGEEEKKDRQLHKMTNSSAVFIARIHAC